MLEEQLLEEFAERLRDDAKNKASDFGSDIPLPFDAAIAEAMLGYLEDAGMVGDHELCTYEDTTGQGRCRIVGYSLPEGSTRLELFTSRYVDEGANLNDRELGRLTGQAAKFFDCVSRGDLARFAKHPAAAEAADYIHRNLDQVDEVRVYVLTNATVRARAIDEIEIRKRRIEFSVWDLERLHRAVGEEVTRGRIEVDFEDLLGRPIPCLEMKPHPKEYQTFLLILPGKLLYELYEKFGPRLFEFNVRSFLQVKGAVNKGLRDTIKNAPEMFLAYNNGLTATADEIDVGIFRGEKVIRSLRGLQIVNGAQTTASIHRAKRSDKLDISKVSVSLKLTRVEPSKLAEFVPLISKYANTQNPVQMADLSANSEFHIRLEKLAERIWCPGEESRWFYERARGSYQVSRMRLGATPARRKVFDNLCPRSQQFGKTELAKYWMSRWLHPHVVSKGAQKNFNAFMAELQDRYPSDWLPDDQFFEETVAIALLFRATRSSVRAAGIKSYAANVVTYSLAKLFDQHGAAKLAINRARDKRVADALRTEGWKVVRVWEHEIKADPEKIAARVRRIVRKPDGRGRKP
ncbi:AIPR family protein [Bradyrhizobium sp.]|uniref:AIPR family protein n=1 Tax=Bradyrhizobium sp. TaxID=376 RepID=UPI001DCBC38B|nr:AIPR family protein [Bradyrhizobium sp.]MBI5318725.1 AIPR family protein [Bradyrhizobium sp.]